MRYETGEAIIVKSSLPASEYRSGFDIAYPLAPMGIFQVRHRANRTDRPLLLSFKGSCAGKPRAKYAAWNNARDIVVLCTDQDKVRLRVGIRVRARISLTLTLTLALALTLTLSLSLTRTQNLTLTLTLTLTDPIPIPRTLTLTRSL